MDESIVNGISEDSIKRKQKKINLLNTIKLPKDLKVSFDFTNILITLSSNCQ